MISDPYTSWFGCKSKIHLIEHISRTTGNWVVIRISLWSANQSAAAQRFSARTDVLPLLCDVLPLLCGILHINQVICGKKKKKWNRFFSKCGEITKKICQNDIEPGFIDRQWWWKREFRRDSGVGVSEYRCTWYRLRCTSSSKNVWGVVVLVVRVGGWLPYGNPSNCGKALLCSSSIISDFLEYRYVSLKWRRYGGWKITSLKSSSCWL